MHDPGGLQYGGRCRAEDREIRQWLEDGLLKPDEAAAAFVREYATDFCAKAAAIRAGYSEPSARQTGYMLLRNPVVREQLVKHMEKASSASVMSQREVLERDSAIASVDPLAVGDRHAPQR